MLGVYRVLRGSKLSSCGLEAIFLWARSYIPNVVMLKKKIVCYLVNDIFLCSERSFVRQQILPFKSPD